MRIHFQDHEVVVRSDAFVIVGPPPVVLKLRDIQAAYCVRGDPHPARTVAARLAAVALAVAVVTFPVFDWSPWWLLVAALVPLSAGLYAATVRLCPPIWEIRAVRDDVEVRLFASRDQIRFGQVRRALGRALESGR
jgi:hypothetical protein